MKRLIAAIALLIALAIFPLVVTSDYYIHLMILVLMWVVIGGAWNLLAGFTGQVSFGHAAFFGFGAYTAGILTTNFGASAWWGVPLGGVCAAILGVPFGWISFRLRGAYFALVTLALGEVMRYWATIHESLTNGMVGILIIQSFVSKLPYYYIILGIATVSIIAVEVVMRSKWGYYFLSIREDQDVAESLGINTTRYKNLSLFISSVLTGVAGGFYMNYMGFIDPHVVFSLHDISIMAILVSIVGGVGTVYGAVAGAFTMVAIQELFRTGFFGLLEYLGEGSGLDFLVKATGYFKQAHVLGFGLLVVFVILFLPNGIVGDWPKILRILRLKREETGG